MTFSRLVMRVSHLSLAVAACGAAALAALVIYTVFMRWVVGQTPNWAEELPRLVLIWTALLGSVTCTYQRSHLNAGLLPLIVRSIGARRIIGKATDIVLLIMLLVLAKAGWDLTILTMSMTTTALKMPVGIIYLSVPVGCVGMALMQVQHVLSSGDSL